jgi:hypothetical protein
MTKHSGLIKKLAKVAPSIHFSVVWEPDHSFVWDGDGPDPSERGYQAYDVAVYARAIVGGAHLEGVNYLGGSYSKPGKHDPNVHGYLNQMLDEALDELSKNMHVGYALSNEIKKAQALLKREREKAYARQMKGRK